MLPKTHILLGAVFSAVLYILYPSINLFYLILIFLSSFLIDFDHYVFAALKTKSFNLKKAFRFHILQGRLAMIERARGIRIKGDFHLFHTIEFLLAVYIASFLWKPFIFIFIGMIFHSFLDLIYLIYNDMLYRREFFLMRWLGKRLKRR